MKICFCYHTPPDPTLGGIERTTLNLMKYFNSQGIDACFYHVKSYNEQLDAEAIKGILLSFNKYLTDNNIDIVIDQFGYVFLTHEYIPKHVKIVRCIHHDTIFKYRLRALWDCVDLKYDRSSINYLLYLLNTPRSLRRDRKLLRDLLSGDKIDKIVYLSDKFAEYEYNIVKCNRNKFEVIPNAVDEHLLKASALRFKKSKTIVWCGRILQLHKNVMFLTRLWKALMHKFPDWNMVLVGDGIDRGRIENEISKLNLQRISITGTADSYPYYEDAAILAFPSYSEGFGMVLLEGMAHGCVPVVFDTTASFRDIIEPSKSGFICDGINERQFINYCAKLMTDEGLRTKMAGSAQKRVSKFSIEKIGKKWISLFDDISKS